MVGTLNARLLLSLFYMDRLTQRNSISIMIDKVNCCSGYGCDEKDCSTGFRRKLEYCSSAPFYQTVDGTCHRNEGVELGHQCCRAENCDPGPNGWNCWEYKYDTFERCKEARQPYALVDDGTGNTCVETGAGELWHAVIAWWKR